MIDLYLASASPRRKEILENMKLSFKVRPIEADESLETLVPMESAGEILAARKAYALKEALLKEGNFKDNTVILAADTLVYVDGVRLGKPKDEADALEMLKMLSGRAHSVCTGICLLTKDKSVSKSDVTSVVMRAFTEEEARKYLATKEPLDKAGAYGIQGIGAVLVEEIHGDFFTVMGLSPKSVAKLLLALGYPYFSLTE